MLGPARWFVQLNGARSPRIYTVAWHDSGIGLRAQGVDLSSYNFLGIGPSDADLEASVKDDVHKLRSSPLIAKQIKINGFVYDVKVCSLAPAPTESNHDMHS